MKSIEAEFGYTLMDEALPAVPTVDAEKRPSVHDLPWYTRVRNGLIPLVVGAGLLVGARQMEQSSMSSVAQASELSVPSNLETIDPSAINIGDTVWARSPLSSEPVSVVVKNFVQAEKSGKLIGIIGVLENQPNTEEKQDLYTFNDLFSEKTPQSPDLAINPPQE